MVAVQYEDSTGRKFVWESVDRTTRQEGQPDGVAILARVSSYGKGTQVLLVAQFRAAVGSWVLEFPAGLIDPGESIEQAAARELKEETGYSGDVVSISPSVFGEPGMTNNCAVLAIIDVDGDSPINANPTLELQPGEVLERLLLPLDENLLPRMLQLVAERCWTLDARLYVFAAGLQLGTQMAARTAIVAASAAAVAAAVATEEAVSAAVAEAVAAATAVAATVAAAAAVAEAAAVAAAHMQASVSMPAPGTSNTAEMSVPAPSESHSPSKAAADSSRCGEPSGSSSAAGPSSQPTAARQPKRSKAAAAAAGKASATAPPQPANQTSSSSTTKSKVALHAAGAAGRGYGHAVGNGRSCVILDVDGEEAAEQSDDDEDDEDEDAYGDLDINKMTDFIASQMASDPDMEGFEDDIQEVLMNAMAARGMQGLPLEDLTLDMILQLGLEGLGLEDAGLSFGDEDDDEGGGSDSGGWETDDGEEDEELEEAGVVKMMLAGASAQRDGTTRSGGGPVSGGMQRRGAGQHGGPGEKEGGDSWWQGRGKETQDVGLGRGLQRARDLERMKGGGGVSGFLWRSWQKQPEIMCCGLLLGAGATAMLVLGSKARWSLST